MKYYNESSEKQQSKTVCLMFKEFQNLSFFLWTYQTNNNYSHYVEYQDRNLKLNRLWVVSFVVCFRVYSDRCIHLMQTRSGQEKNDIDQQLQHMFKNNFVLRIQMCFMPFFQYLIKNVETVRAVISLPVVPYSLSFNTKSQVLVNLAAI